MVVTSQAVGPDTDLLGQFGGRGRSGAGQDVHHRQAVDPVPEGRSRGERLLGTPGPSGRRASPARCARWTGPTPRPPECVRGRGRWWSSEGGGFARLGVQATIAIRQAPSGSGEYHGGGRCRCTARPSRPPVPGGRRRRAVRVTRSGDARLDHSHWERWGRCPRLVSHRRAPVPPSAGPRRLPLRGGDGRVPDRGRLQRAGSAGQQLARLGAGGSGRAVGQRRRLLGPAGGGLDRAAGLGCNSFRLERRVGPGGPRARRRGPVGPGRYASIVRGCLDRGLEPLVTLHHFTHPAWLGEDFWLRPDAADRFRAWAELAVGRAGAHGAPLGHHQRDQRPGPRDLVARDVPAGAGAGPRGRGHRRRQPAHRPCGRLRGHPPGPARRRRHHQQLVHEHLRVRPAAHRSAAGPQHGGRTGRARRLARPSAAASTTAPSPGRRGRAPAPRVQCSDVAVRGRLGGGSPGPGSSRPVLPEPAPRDRFLPHRTAGPRPPQPGGEGGLRQPARAHPRRHRPRLLRAGGLPPLPAARATGRPAAATALRPGSCGTTRPTRRAHPLAQAQAALTPGLPFWVVENGMCNRVRKGGPIPAWTDGTVPATCGRTSPR